VAKSGLATHPVVMVGSCLVTRPLIIAVLITTRDPITHPHMTLQAKRPKVKRLLALTGVTNNISRRRVSRHMVINHRPLTSTVRLFRVLTGITQNPTSQSMIITPLARDPTQLPVALTPQTQYTTSHAMDFLRTPHLQTAYMLHRQVSGHMLTPHSRWTMITRGSLAPRLVVLELLPTTGTKNTHRTQCLKIDNILPHRMLGEKLMPQPHVCLQHNLVVVIHRPAHRMRYPWLSFK